MSDYPGPHPDPPANRSSRQPLVSTLEPGARLYRMHWNDKGALFFGKTRRNRFDAPDGSYGVLYLAQDAHCAFIETFGQSIGESLISISALEKRLLTEVGVTRELRLIDLVDSGGLTRIGADGRLLDSSHDISQRWSGALKRHPLGPAGLRCRALRDPARMAYALFEEAKDALIERSMGSLTDVANAPLLAAILNTYDFGVID